MTGKKNTDEILILKRHIDNIFFKYTKYWSIKQLLKNFVKEWSIFDYALRICYILHLPILSIFLWKWKNEIKNYKTIIFFDDWFNNILAKYVKKKYKNIKTILYYRNPINNYSERFLKNKYIDECYTYNKDDTEGKKWESNTNLKYNPQFYTKNIIIKKSHIKYDILFIWRAKDRKNDIIKLSNELSAINIITNFKIIEKESDYIDYDKYLELLWKSKAILDYNYPIVSWLTLRIMEWIFFEKKIITNNFHITKYDFYDPENIFILNYNPINHLEKFLSEPYKTIKKEIINNYDFTSRIKRF